MPSLTSCRAARPAIRPPPTNTTCRDLSVFFTGGASAEIENGLRRSRVRKRLAAELHHLLGGKCRQPRVADQFPEHLVAVAAVDRIGKARLLKQRVHELREPVGERHARLG